MNRFYLSTLFLAGFLVVAGCSIPKLPNFGLPRVPHLFDGDENSVSIKHIAEELCATKSGSTKEQISRVSTVVKLHEFFSNLAEDTKLSDCGKRYNEVLTSLQNLVSVSNENVCSDDKIDLIEDFHRNFISANREDVKQRAADGREAAPEVLRLFFMHYALEISAICKRGLITNIEWDLHDKVKKSDFDFGGHTVLNELMAKMSASFSPVTAINDYDDVLLIWDMVEDDAEEEVDELTGEPVRLLIKAKRVDQIKRVQEKCRCKFRPFYEKLIMPIINLVDIGYSYTGERFERELHELRVNPLVRRWYGVTQICEAILPIRFYQDDKLAERELVIISREEEVVIKEQLAGNIDHTGQVCSGSELKYEPTTNSMVGIDKLESVETIEAQELVYDVNLKVTVRERAIKRAHHRLLKNIQDKEAEHLYYSHRKEEVDGGEVKVSDGNPAEPEVGEEEFVKEGLQERLSEQLKGMSDEEILAMEGAIGTRKRIIKRNKQRPRAGDVNLLQVQNKQVLSYQHTKSWSEMFDGFLDKFAPRKRNIILFGSILIGILVLVLVVA